MEENVKKNEYIHFTVQLKPTQHVNQLCFNKIKKRKKI